MGVISAGFTEGISVGEAGAKKHEGRATEEKSKQGLLSLPKGAFDL